MYTKFCVLSAYNFFHILSSCNPPPLFSPCPVPHPRPPVFHTLSPCYPTSTPQSFRPCPPATPTPPHIHFLFLTGYPCCSLLSGRLYLGCIWSCKMIITCSNIAPTPPLPHPFVYSFGEWLQVYLSWMTGKRSCVSGSVESKWRESVGCGQTGRYGPNSSTSVSELENPDLGEGWKYLVWRIRRLERLTTTVHSFCETEVERTKEKSTPPRV